MQEFDEIWGLVLEELKKDHSETFMSIWMNELKLINLTDTSALIYSQSPFKRDVLEKKHTELVTAALESVIGYSVSVTFTSENRIPEPGEAPVKEPEPEEAPLNEDADPENAEEIPAPIQMAGNVSEYTFENFIVGASNRFAYAACTAVAKQPAHSYNPLFIYGPSGLGKTHLLYAVTNEIKKRFPDYNINYVKGEEFTNQMIESIAKGHTVQFREKYRKSDVLLIDDVHFIAGKESTQEEFFHTFNDLYEHKKQIILTSDRPARDIQHLEERLRTRFEWGLAADIQPPDFELRTAIMQNKAKALGRTFPPEVLTFLAERLTNNIRQIEGAIKRIIAYSQLSGEEITVELVTVCISDMLSATGTRVITSEMIIEKVSEKYGVDKNDILSKKKTSQTSQARHICVYLLRKLVNLSYPSIGKILNRDHSTIISSFNLIDQEIKNNYSFETEINELIKEINS